ncbi:hypothetical protein JCM17960_32690 [Magnetospira thiophila]
MMTLDGGDKASFISRANELVKLENWPEVARLAQDHLDHNPQSAEAWFLAAVSAFQQDNIRDAVDKAEIALSKNHNVLEIVELLASLYVFAGDLSQGLFHGKVALTTTSDPVFSAWVPANLATFGPALGTVRENPLFNKAIASTVAEDRNKAVYWLREHIAFNPQSRKAHQMLGHLLTSAGLYHEAISSLRAAAHVLPRDAAILGQLATNLAYSGQRSAARSVWQAACAIAPENGILQINALESRLTDTAETLDALSQSVKDWGASFGTKPEPWTVDPVAGPRGRLTVGYVLGAAGQNSSGDALADTIAAHDTSKFRLVGFGWGPQTLEQNLKFQKCFDTWHDVRNLDPITFGTMVAAEAVDVLIDACGYGAPDLLAAFGTRLAPVQISWLGAPVGTGMATMDVLLTDATLDPEEAPSPLSERLWRLDSGLAPMQIPDANLPLKTDEPQADSLTLVANVPMEFLSDELLALWAEVLFALPQATLVLQDYAFGHPPVISHLIDMFGNYGLAHRIDLAAPHQTEALYQMGDVCLSPLIVSHPGDAAQALWQGLPVVALNGPDRRHREVVSLLHQLGLDEMIAETSADYVAMVTRWATDNARRSAFRQSIRDRIRQAPPFSAKHRAQSLEATFTALWQEAEANAG